MIEGPAGAGKTAFLQSVLSQATRDGYQVLQSHPAEVETKLSFVGLRDLLDRDFDEIAETLPVRQRRALATALFLEESDDTGPAVVSAATLGAIRAMASRKQVLIVVDDLPWMDPATRGVLGFVLRRLQDEPVRAVFSARCDSPEDGESVAKAIGVATTPIWLEPLSFGAIQLLVRRRCGLVLPRPTMRLLYDACAGNPFYALEIARRIADRGGSLRPGRPLDLPEDLRKLVGERIEALGPATRTVLPTAAALGRPTIVNLIAVIGDAAVVEAAVGDAVAHGVFRTDGDRIEFTHPMLAAAAYHDLPPQERRRMHLELARLTHDTEERAHHLALGAERPSEELARALDDAATMAASRGAPASAAGFAEEAASATPSGQVAEKRRRQVTAAVHHFEAGDTSLALDLLDQVTADEAAGPVRSVAAVRMGRILLFCDELRRAAGFFRRAIESSDASPSVRAEAEEGLAWSLLLAREDLEEASLQARRAVKASLGAETVSMHREEALAVAGLVAVLLGQAAGADLVTEAIQQVGERRFNRVIRHPLWASAVRRIWMDDLIGGREELLTLRQLILEGGDESSLPRVLLALSHAYLLLGDWEAAVKCAREGKEAADDAGQEPQAGMLLWTASMVDAYTGKLDVARDAASRRLAHALEAGHVVATMANRWTLGFCALSAGNLEEAYTHLSVLAEGHEAAGVEEPGALRFVPDLIAVSIRLGRIDEARRLLARYLAQANTTGRVSAQLAAARCQGLLAAAEGRLDEAAQVLRDAVDNQDASTWPFEHARSQLAFGAVLRRSQRRAEARGMLSEAADAFERLGATAWAVQAHEELARIGGRVPSRWQLTPAEAKIADLVAEGRTNKEVAAELFVTVKTVETSLTRIYRKLGVRSRTALAITYGRSTGSKM